MLKSFPLIDLMGDSSLNHQKGYFWRIQRAAASPQPSPRSGEGADGESSPAVSKVQETQHPLGRLRHSFSHVFLQLKGSVMKILYDKSGGRNDP